MLLLAGTSTATEIGEYPHLKKKQQDAAFISAKAGPLGRVDRFPPGVICQYPVRLSDLEVPRSDFLPSEAERDSKKRPSTSSRQGPKRPSR